MDDCGPRGSRVPIASAGLRADDIHKDNGDQQRGAALQDGLRKLGWIEGRTLRSEFAWVTPATPKRARVAAKELVDLEAEVLLVGAAPGLVALRRETTKVPLVLSPSPIPLASDGGEPDARGGKATGLAS